MAPMTLSQLTKYVLDEAYEEILGTEPDKDLAIRNEIQRLSQDYRNLKSKSRCPVDYANATSRFAYIYKYTVAHADYIKQIIQSNLELIDIFEQPSAVTTCIGGGPGSDLLGMLKYVMQWRKSPSLTCYLFDCERAWGDSWSEVAKVLNADFPLYPIFQQFDVTDESTWRSYRKYLRSDLVTLSYFLSEVWSFRPVAQPFFEHLFRHARPGTLFLFVDNNDQLGEFAAWYDTMSTVGNLEILSAVTTDMAFSGDEEKRDLEPYFSKFGWPKRKSNLVYRINRKK